MFSSYHEHPTNVRFEGQDEDEKITQNKNRKTYLTYWQD